MKEMKNKRNLFLSIAFLIGYSLKSKEEEDKRGILARVFGEEEKEEEVEKEEEASADEA